MNPSWGGWHLFLETALAGVPCWSLTAGIFEWTKDLCTYEETLSLSLFLIYLLLLINFQSKSKSNLSTPLVLDTYVYVVYTHTYMSMHLESKGSQESFLSARSSTVSCAPVDDTSPWTCATRSVKEYRWLVIQWGFDHHRDFDIRSLF
jgi:hypothetical protein